jgi:hypothetical protein
VHDIEFGVTPQGEVRLAQKVIMERGYTISQATKRLVLLLLVAIPDRFGELVHFATSAVRLN